MAAVFEETLKKNISKGELLPVYILFGSDGYLKKNYSDKIGSKIAEPDDIFNYCKFTADSDLQEIYDAVLQIPFMGDKKFVELYDFDFEHCAKSEFDRICELVSQVPDTTVFVLRFDSVEFDIKKSSKFKKLVAAAEKSGGMAVNLDHRKTPELVKMLVDGAAKRGCKLEPAAARYLVETAGDDISLLQNELIKLCAFSNGQNITVETVDKVCVKTVEASVFNLSKFILESNTSAAIACLDELFYMRIEPIIILSTVSSVYVDMLRVLAAKQQGENVSAVSQAFGYKGKEFLLDKASVNLRKFDLNKIDLSLSALMEADRSLKSYGADARIVLEQLIIRLIYIAAKGETVD